MKKMVKVILAAAAVVALAVPAMAADKLIVKDVNGRDAFIVNDTGTMTGQYWDGSKFVVNNYFSPSTKKYGFGTSTPRTSLHVVEEAATADRGLTIAQHTTGAQSASIAIYRSRGTEANPTLLALNDNVAAFHMMPYDGNPWTPPALPVYAASATLAWQVDGVPSVGSIPVAVQFFTGSGGVTRLERFRISSNGRFRVSNQPAAPANNAACTVGDMIFDAPNGFLYMCTATNSWKRTAFAAY